MSQLIQTESARARLPLDIADRTVPAVLWRNLRSQPDRLALVAPSALGNDLRVTWSELADQVEQVAAGLQEHGLKRGDRLALILNNTAAREFLLTQLACLRLGATAVLVNPAFKQDELLHALSLTKCRAAVVLGAAAGTFRAVAAQLPDLKTVFETTARPEAPHLPWSDLLNPGRRLDRDAPWPDEDDIAHIIMTSGTTGRSKAVLLTHGNSVAGGTAMLRGWDIKRSDVVQCPLPLTSSAGCCVALMGSMCAGATLIIDPPFDAEVTFERVRTEQSTVLIIVPSIVIFMLEQFDPARHDLSTVRLFAYGASPMTVATIKRTLATFPDVELRQIYSMTESSTVGAYLAFEFLEAKLGSVGKPLLCEMCIVDDAGRRLPVGEVGEILTRGAGVMLGYDADPDATAAALADGWLHTGDLGYIDQDGFVFHVDRKKDIIVRGAMNVGSVEVENVLLQHPAVMQVAVVGVPHEKLGEDVFAFIVARPGQTVNAAMLLDHGRELLAEYKVPRRYAFVEELPRNAAGKVLKRELRQRAELALKAR